jgi:adenylate cyclase
LPHEQQRRLAAILAADVVGYSRLMADDELATLACLKRLRAEVIEPRIAEYQGRIVGSAGDSLLVEFVSAVGAVECAIEMQSAIRLQNAELPPDRSMQFRMGVNLGDVIAENQTIYGDGVNIAARLEKLSEPGGVCIARNVYDQVKGKLACAFTDLGEQRVHNIPELIHAYRIKPPDSPSASSSDSATKSFPPLPDKPSIAVLPFQNMSGDPEQEYFADGVVEEIITALSRIRWLFVIARNSSFTYKGRAVHVKQVGLELGVRYVLEGSVRKAGNRVRITGQLIDVSTGSHIWADRFDGELANIFDLQDQVTASVVGAIEPMLEQAEIERAKRKPTESLDAYDHYLRGLAAVHQWTREGNREALAHFTRATELDPNFASAFGMAARCYAQRVGFAWVTDRAHEVAETRRLAHRASELAKDDAGALATAGQALFVVVGEVGEAVALIDRALKLNPNLAWAWFSSGFARVSLGNLEEAIDHVSRSMRLSPQDPQMFAQQMVIAAAHLFAGHWDEAFLWAEKSIRERPNFFAGHCLAAASGAFAGKMAEARKALERARLLDPELRLSNLKDLQPFRQAEHLARLGEGLTMAGLPE